MWDRLWDFFIDTLVVLFMPLVCSYHTLSSNAFLNVSARDATGLEWAGNVLLTPVQYLLAGREAVLQPDGSWELVQRFDYTHAFWVKTVSSALAAAPSLVLGTAVKGVGVLSPHARHPAVISLIASTEIHSNRAAYEALGIALESSQEPFAAQGHMRRAGDEKVMAIEKEALRAIGALLNEAGIPWWLDCGTCLGAYRYGGVIPWDCDLDIAVLLPDFSNVQKALNRLDPAQYVVQNWSSRESPNTYLKVYIRQSNTMIDIYHFEIIPETKQLRYILSLESNLFAPEWWKVRERRYKAPVAIDTVFPLKKASLDGVEVFVPNDTVKYLQRYYGENLDPVKIYDASTGRYEKDLSHPYWQNTYVK